MAKEVLKKAVVEYGRDGEKFRFLVPYLHQDQANCKGYADSKRVWLKCAAVRRDLARCEAAVGTLSQKRAPGKQLAAARGQIAALTQELVAAREETQRRLAAEADSAAEKLELARCKAELVGLKEQTTELRGQEEAATRSIATLTVKLRTERLHYTVEGPEPGCAEEEKRRNAVIEAQLEETETELRHYSAYAEFLARRRDHRFRPSRDRGHYRRMEKQPASNPEYGAPPPYSPNEQAPPPAYPAPAGSGTNYSTSYAAPGVTGPLPPINHPQQAYPAGTVVVVTQGTNFLGPDPVTMSCPKCSAQVVTNTEFENGLLTWLLCGGLAIFGCIYGCCLIPFCVDSAKNTIHSCPNCNQYIGTYRRI